MAARGPPVPRSSQFEEYLKATAAAEVPLAGRSFSVSSSSGISKEELSSRVLGNVTSVAAWTAGLLGEVCMRCLGTYLAYGLKFGWSMYNVYPIVYNLNSVGISYVNNFGSRHCVEYLALVMVVLLVLMVTVCVFPLHLNMLMVLMVMLPVLFGYASAHCLCSQSRTANRATQLIQTYANVIKKLQCMQCGKALLHPLPPVSRLEEALLNESGLDSPLLAMKPLRVALATAQSDLEVSLMAYCTRSPGHPHDWDDKRGGEGEVLAHLDQMGYQEGEMTVVTVKSIQEKCEHLFTTVLPLIINSRISPWTTCSVIHDNNTLCSCSNSNSSFLYIVATNRSADIFSQIVLPMLHSGFDLLALCGSLRMFEQTLESMMPEEASEWNSANSASRAPGDSIVSVNADADADTYEKNDLDSFPKPTDTVHGTYKELRQQLAGSRAAAEDLLLRLWRCEKQLAAAAPALLLTTSSPSTGTGTGTDSHTSPVTGSLVSHADLFTSSVQRHRNNACASLLLSMELLAGNGVDVADSIAACATSDLSEATVRSVVAGITSREAIPGISSQDTASLLDTMSRCVLLLQEQSSRGNVTGANAQLPSGSDECSKDSGDTVGADSALRQSPRHFEDKNEYVTASFLDEVSGDMMNSTALERGQEDLRGGLVEVLTGQVLTSEEIESDRRERQGGQSRYAQQESSARQRQNLMAELNDQIIILKASEVMRERERMLPSPASCTSPPLEGRGARNTVNVRFDTASEVKTAGICITSGASELEECTLCDEGGAWRGILQHELSLSFSSTLAASGVRSMEGGGSASSNCIIGDEYTYEIDVLDEEIETTER